MLSKKLICIIQGIAECNKLKLSRQVDQNDKLLKGNSVHPYSQKGVSAISQEQ